MRTSSAVVAILCALCAAPAAAAEADDLLAQVDRAISSATDKVWMIKMRVIATDGDVREGKMLMLQGSHDKRILRFLQPASMRNTAMLALGTNDLYVFLAGEGRTRRLGSSALNQTFLGSDFTFEDLGNIYFRDQYVPKLAGQKGDERILELTPKIPNISWSRLRLSVEEHGLVRRIEYYDKSGKHARTQTRTFERGKAQYESWVPVRVLMVNELTKHATELMMQVADADRGIPQDVFSLRGLQRGDDLRFAP
jgi:hypothetical protein